MFSNFIELDEGMAINKKHVVAIEAVLWKPDKAAPEVSAEERTRITLLGGRQVLMACKYEVAKRLFL